MKKWLSRGLVLAMIVAMMIPTPVLAKSSSGGKLVKSVSYYSLTSDGSGWKLQSKTSYQYDKKNNPKEIKQTGYNHYMGVPVSASSRVLTLKYKYKGKTPKSMTISEEGFALGSAKYLKGKLASSNSSWKSSNDTGTFAQASSTSEYYSYAKNGLPVAGAYSYIYSETGGEDDTNVTYNSTYVWDQKKGIPSLLLETRTYADDGWVGTEYAHFNKKGLVTDNGTYNRETGAFERPDYVYSYTMKKGVVTEAIRHRVNSDGTTTPVALYKFTYAKTKISKSRYFNMINSFVLDEDAPSCFNWF